MLNDIQKAYQYADDVRSGKILVNKLVKLAVERYYHDHETAESRGFYWDPRAAQKALLFFELLCFTKGKWQGKPFILEPWQCFIVANIFGWKRSDDDKRRFTESYVEIPKKNGKTELAAGVGLFMLMMDNEPGAEVYAAAYTRDQAGICFDGAKTMASKSVHIRSRLDVLTYNLAYPANESKMSAVSHDASNTEGKNSHCVLFDEYHVHKTDDVKTSLRSGMAAREQPLFFTITTAGSNRQGPCYKYREGCIEVLEKKFDRDNMFCIIYGVDKDDKWDDPAIWKKANPNYGVSVRPQFLEGEFEKAKTNGREEVEFKTKHLNIWVDADVTWIPSEKWDAVADSSYEPPYNARCYGGIDLSSTNDITAFSLYFPGENGATPFFKRWLFVPEEKAKSVKIGVSYDQWVKEGHLIATPGQTINYGYLKNVILEAAEKWDLQFIAYDRWNSSQLVQDLNGELGEKYVLVDGKGTYEYVMQPFGQGFQSMSTPTKAYEVEILEDRIRHDGNPVMHWMIGNVALSKDPAENIKPDKAKSKNKIDGVVADIMALGEYLAWNWVAQDNNEIAAW